MSNTKRSQILRSIPSVDVVLEAVETIMPNVDFSREYIVDTIRETLDGLRTDIIEGRRDSLPDNIADACVARLNKTNDASLKHVINATGVVLHTNLGRSVLAKAAIDAVADVVKGYSTLEYDTSTMARGSRHDHCSELLRRLTGAEDAIAVNNNAAATYMVLSEFAKGASAVVSRGEEVEIGGSFRIPDIMSYSGVDMIEVGTTNKTHARDFTRAITNEVGLLLKVHTSNYRIAGFTEAVSIEELRAIADAENTRRAACGVEGEVLVYGDLGSGALLPIRTSDGTSEPVVSDALKAGCDIVTFSGDKLLGGPQAGIIAGRSDLIARLKENPLARVCRLDKMTIAALEATLRLYTNPNKARTHIPTLRMLSLSADAIKADCEMLAVKIKSKTADSKKITLTIDTEVGRAGGGSLPMCELDTYVVTVKFAEGNAQDCAAFLIQQNCTPIVARIRDDSLMFDPRTVIDESEMDEIANGISNYLLKR